MTLPPVQRAAERDRLIARRKAEAPDTYAPFTIDEYRRLPLDYAFIDECVQWPARTPELGRRARSCPMRPIRTCRCWWSPGTSTT